MGRYIIPAAIVLVGLTLYALFEALMTPAHEVRSLPKWGWVAVVVLLPLVGPLLWLVLAVVAIFSIFSLFIWLPLVGECGGERECGVPGESEQDG